MSRKGSWMSCVVWQSEQIAAFRIALQQHLLAVHRGFVFREFRRVAGAAGVRKIEPPPVVVRRVRRIDVVRVVTVVASGVGVRLVGLAGLRVDRLHIAADHFHHAGQLDGLVGLVVVFLGFLELVFVTGDAADLHLDLVVRNLGDVGVAFDALQFAVHTAEEAILEHHRKLLLAGGRRRRESFQAVAAQAHFAGELGFCLIGRCVLRARVRGRQASRGDDANEGSGDPGRDTRNPPAHPKLIGSGIFILLSHDNSALAGRLHADTPITVKNSTEFAESKLP